MKGEPSWSIYDQAFWANQWIFSPCKAKMYAYIGLFQLNLEVADSVYYVVLAKTYYFPTFVHCFDREDSRKLGGIKR